MVQAHPVPALPPTSALAAEDVVNTHNKLREIAAGPKPVSHRRVVALRDRPDGKSLKVGS